ncbi:MAG: hypothetical protein K4571_10325 [Deltaproteobacteria bacterium]
MDENEQSLKERILNLSDSELIKMAYIESIDYRKEAVQFAISEVKRRGLQELNIKHCPRCRKSSDGEVAICQCGYNFNEPNIDQIKQVEKRRRRNNRLLGLVMILLGSFFLFFHIQSPNASMGSLSNMIYYGIPSCLILIGLIKLLSGGAVRLFNKTVFDAVLGDESKEEGDDVEYRICPACGQQLLTEISQNKCPKCGNLIEQEKQHINLSNTEASQVLICPHCGAKYNPNDYREDAPEWLCSECRKQLPKK